MVKQYNTVTFTKYLNYTTVDQAEKYVYTFLTIS